MDNKYHPLSQVPAIWIVQERTQDLKMKAYLVFQTIHITESETER